MIASRLDNAGESIASPRFRHDEPGRDGAVAQGASHLPHAVVETGLGVDDGIAPHGALELLAGDQLPGSIQKHFEHDCRLGARSFNWIDEEWQPRRTYTWVLQR